MTNQGRRDVSFQDYANIASNPTGPTAQSIGYVSPDPLPSVSPEVESAINAYIARDNALARGDRIDPYTGKPFDPVTRYTNMGILGALSGFTRDTIRDQLTTPLNYYTGTATGPGIIGRATEYLTRPDANVDRYVPVTNRNGQIIGSMSVDAAGNPLGYTGTKTTDATFNDPNINIEAARQMIDPFESSGGAGDNDNNNDVGAPSAPTTPTTPTPECPDGYMYDEATQSCVVDPFQQGFGVGAPYTGPYEVSGPYTQMPAVTAPTITPVGAPVTIAPPVVAPITVAPQTPAGLASLNPNTP